MWFSLIITFPFWIWKLISHFRLIKSFVVICCRIFARQPSFSYTEKKEVYMHIFWLIRTTWTPIKNPKSNRCDLIKNHIKSFSVELKVFELINDNNRERKKRVKIVCEKEEETYSQNRQRARLLLETCWFRAIWE